jgi:hypothetical protein
MTFGELITIRLRIRPTVQTCVGEGFLKANKIIF